MGVENAAGFDAATCAGAAPGTLVATAAVCVGFDDEKSFTYFKSDKKHAEDDLIDLMDLSQRTIERGYPEKDKVIIKGDSNKFRELLKDKSWMNMYAAH